jgi:tRNA nucleotidyltransferase (CCA-adding enzyme)
MPPPTIPEASHFPHDADLGVCGVGRTREEAFEQAALALCAAVVEPEAITPSVAVSLSCEAPDDRLLLADFLNAVIYEMATRRLVFSRFSVAISAHTLRATAWGEPIDLARHAPAVEPKGATYTALHVGERPDGAWEARCVVDV